MKYNKFSHERNYNIYHLYITCIRIECSKIHGNWVPDKVNMIERDSSKLTIDISDLGPGVYILYIKTERENIAKSLMIE